MSAYTIRSHPDHGGVVLYGTHGAVALTGDASWAITVHLGNPPADGVPMALFACAGLYIEALYESPTTWRVRAKTFIASGGSITTTASDPLDLDTRYELRVTHDVAAEQVLVYVDGAVVATGVAGQRAAAVPRYTMSLPAASWFTSAAVWSSVLSPTPSTLDEAGLIQWKIDSGADHFWLFHGAIGPYELEDDQIGTMDLTPNGDGSPGDATGPTAAFTLAAEFSGDRMGHHGAQTVDLNQDFTIGFWIKTSDTYGIALSGRTESYDYWYLIIRDTPALLKWQIDSPTTTYARYPPSGLDVSDDEWHYVHAWRDYNATASLDEFGLALDNGTPVTFTRNEFDGSGTLPAAMFVLEQLYVFSRAAAGGTLGGDLQHLTLWLGKVLSPTERTTDYEAEQGTPP